MHAENKQMLLPFCVMPQNMSIRQLATLGRRAVLSQNVRIAEGPADLRNQRYFSQGGKVFSEEEKAQENIFIKVSHRLSSNHMA